MPSIEMDKIKLEAYCDAVQGGRNYMEDVINVQLVNAADRDVGSPGPYAYFSVFDGHGGSEAAIFADKHLRREIHRQEMFWSDDDGSVIDAIKDGFVSTHKLMMTAVGQLCFSYSYGGSRIYSDHTILAVRV